MQRRSTAELQHRHRSHVRPCDSLSGARDAAAQRVRPRRNRRRHPARVLQRSRSRHSMHLRRKEAATSASMRCAPQSAHETCTMCKCCNRACALTFARHLHPCMVKAKLTARSWPDKQDDKLRKSTSERVGIVAGRPCHYLAHQPLGLSVAMRKCPERQRNRGSTHSTKGGNQSECPGHSNNSARTSPKLANNVFWRALFLQTTPPP